MHPANKTGEDFSIQHISSQLAYSTSVWYLVYFSPESLLKALLGPALCPGGAQEVQVCKDTHHPREAMNLQHIQELKRLHFKPKAGVHQQQYLQSVCGWGGGRRVCWEGGVVGGGRRWGQLTSCLLNCRTYQVCNLGHINHGVQIIATLYQSQSTFLPCTSVTQHV